MEDVKELIEEQFLEYASYVIMDRAIPHIDDGLKPVQRRILWTLFSMDDGKLHKVANVAGQTMAYHPHGDAPIVDALVTLANKDFLLDRQGNFGNIYTGDPAAAARYIETRLTPMGRETLFNKDLTQFIASYDGRKQEPKLLPAKIPFLLLQGVDGIAVGMSTHIFPHNFQEVLEAQIAYLQKKPFTLVPDFPTGGIMDPSSYDDGRGKVRLRAKIEEADPKTLVIRDICYGTTTESLIRSIDEAAKKGKVKIDSIHDYTAEKVEIEIKLPRGVYANELKDALYHYTDCEVVLHSHITVIRDEMPWEGTVSEVLAYSTEKLQEYLQRELELEQERLLEKIHFKTLERLFIEKRMYKQIEELKEYEKIHESIAKQLVPYHKKLQREPTYEDREKLLQLPIRRISRFDLEKNLGEIQLLEEKLEEVSKDLSSMKKVTIRYLKDLLKKYGKNYERKTVLEELEELDTRALQLRELLLGLETKSGFLGTKITNSSFSLPCTNFDKISLLYDDGSYKVISPPEKTLVYEKHRKAVQVSVVDKKSVVYCIYRDPKTRIAFAKCFVIEKFILDKEYRYFEEGMELLFLSKGEPPKVTVQFVAKPKQKQSKINFDFSEVLVKGVKAKGIRVTSRAVRKVVLQGQLKEDQLELFSS